MAKDNEIKAAEAHTLSDEEIDVELRRLFRRLFDLRTQGVTEKIEDTSQFKKIRRAIARLKTERSMRAARAAEGAAA